ncbi:MAG: CoA transferase [Chloroflexota bacterium]|nr:CoA transferase [Chloroflexota bacterium]MDE2883710.1 CoA transferase [Chloroflexota bacterium]
MNALEGLRVVDLTTIVSGPYAAAILADLGADVVKVEPPGGENARHFRDDPSLVMGSLTPHVMNLQRNKRGMVVDLRSEGGREVLEGLVRWADVVIDNYRPGVTARLGVDYPSLRALNPRVVACSITGYGLTGPGRDRAALDATVQAFAGVMGMTGDPDGSPVRAGPLYGDLCAGMAGALGILAALAARERTGEGQHVDISMLDVQMSLINYHAVMHLMSGIPTPRTGNEMKLHVPYNAYQATGGWIFIAVSTDPHWKVLVETLNAPEAGLEGAARQAAGSLRDEALTTRAGRIANRDRINAALETVVAARSRDEWVGMLASAGIPVAPVNTLDEAVQDAQVRSRGMIVEVEHPEGGVYEATGNPFKLSAAGEERFTPPPTLGQHTTEVLRDVLGYDDERIAGLYADGSVA